MKGEKPEEKKEYVPIETALEILAKVAAIVNRENDKRK